MVFVFALMSILSSTLRVSGQSLDRLSVRGSYHHWYQILSVLVDENCYIDLVLGFEGAPADSAAVFDVLRHCTSHSFSYDVGQGDLVV